MLARLPIICRVGWSAARACDRADHPVRLPALAAGRGGLVGADLPVQWAISMLVPPGPGCGFERPGLGQRPVAPALRVPGRLRLGRLPPGRCLRDPPGTGRTRPDAPGRWTGPGAFGARWG